MPGGPSKPSGRDAERGREVDLAQVEAGVERAGVAEAVEVVARAREQRDVGARLGEAPGQRARDEGGAAAREEERSGHHAQEA